ncbi:F-box domain-containing protein [Mycena indigotica]|uniref:F-box domain-containing protein n=1 Tax=Mycena indigotica TaxID=2126181 RepID=A0A8H6TC43_9AGAR|nr:F-box domain-containing protein [Mycena indigotica]KAF7316055.1 F-box domain-containing protein [Mycena indigotica]
MDPATMLPIELLIEVFELCQEPHQVGFPTGNLMRESPWLLSLVSHEWRTIALSTPSLWRKLCIYFSPFPENVTELTRAFLRRSASFPFSLVICDDGVNFLPAHRQLISLVTEQSHRWTHLHIISFGCDNKWEQSLASIDGPGCLTMLTQVNLARTEVSNTLLNFFAHAPRLQVAFLPVLPAGILGDGLFPWHQLTTLTTDYIDLLVDPMLRTLHAIPNLRTLSLRAIGMDDTTPSPSPSLHRRTWSLSSLETLTLRISDSAADSYRGALLDGIRLPILTTLSLETLDSSICHQMAALFQRSARTSHPLTSLSLSCDSPLFASELIPVLRQIPHLSHLVISEAIIMDDVLMALILQPADVLIPLLDFLALQDTRFTPELLLRVVRSRFNDGYFHSGLPRRLKYLRMSLHIAEIEPEVARGFNDLCDLGLDARLLR